MTCDRIYCDNAGQSHFDRVEFELTSMVYAPPAPPLDVSASQPAARVVFWHAPAGWIGDFHPSPRQQICFGLSGQLEVTVSDGEVRAFPPGSAVLLEDTAGTGHHTKVAGEADFYGAFVHLD